MNSPEEINTKENSHHGECFCWPQQQDNTQNQCCRTTNGERHTQSLNGLAGKFLGIKGKNIGCEFGVFGAAHDEFSFHGVS